MRAAELTEVQLDALREIGGIGAGQAATTLSELVGRTVRIEVPAIEVIEVTRMPYVFGGPEDIVGAVYARLGGEIDGGLLCMATPEAVRMVIGLLGETVPEDDCAPDDRGAAAVVDAMGHLMGSYVRAVSEMTGLEAHATEISWAYDMVGALLEAVVSEVSSRADSAVFVRTAFVDLDHVMDVAFFFVPDPDSLAAILGRLGLA